MRRGFTLIELLISVGIIAMLAAVVTVAVLPARRRARDTVRVAEMNQMGRFLLAISCYAPTAGPGDYDLQALYQDLVAANPSVAQYIKEAPRDPKSGTGTESGYRYAYTADGKCALYANLENPQAIVTLEGLTAPTPGAGTGVLRAASQGPNGSDIYFQIGR
ncbi:MAG TPA: type II secretion system protein [Candidatus Baltobacteraceae bacterium]|jgi:prepilin-type N-terminal cleavage/methylation domain-containing protein|nr:type II secretion system protein [Candidatus Baltobacteraceae bacterium]